MVADIKPLRRLSVLAAVALAIAILLAAPLSVRATTTPSSNHSSDAALSIGDGQFSQVRTASGAISLDTAASIYGYDDPSNVARASVSSGRYRLAPNTARSLNLPFRDAGLRSQVDDVVRHFDELGAPPSGIAQGGLKGHPIGTYGNKSGALPQQPLGYYAESDVWMSGAGVKRGAERLIFGRGGEVYYSPNHYDSFVRMR